MNRRRFMAAATSGVAALGWSTRRMQSLKSSAAAYPIRIGGPIFDPSEDPEELAIAHRKLAYSAAYCPKVSLGDNARIKAIVESFKKHDLVIAEVGRWVNLVERDAIKRKKNVEYVTEGLALAEALGALCCVDIPGSYNEEAWYGPHPGNLSQTFFDEIVENARKIIDAVKPRRTTFCYETVGWSIPRSVEDYSKLIEAVDRPAFSVHFDPCNLINSPERFYRNQDLLNEWFDRLGSRIVSCHAKDLKWEVEMNIHFREVRPGSGSLDYATYLERLATLPQQPPLMLEHLPNAEEYDKGCEYLFNLGKQIGVVFA